MNFRYRCGVGQSEYVAKVFQLHFRIMIRESRAANIGFGEPKPLGHCSHRAIENQDFAS